MFLILGRVGSLRVVRLKGWKMVNVGSVWDYVRNCICLEAVRYHWRGIPSMGGLV